MSTTPHKNFAAGEDLSANQFRFVKFDGSGDLIAATAASDIVGIQTDEPVSGKAVGLAKTSDTAKLKIGGTVTVGAKLQSDANARGIVTTVAGQIYGAKALQAGAIDDIINVEVVTATQTHS